MLLLLQHSTGIKYVSILSADLDYIPPLYRSNHCSGLPCSIHEPSQSHRCYIVRFLCSRGL